MFRAAPSLKTEGGILKPRLIFRAFVPNRTSLSAIFNDWIGQYGTDLRSTTRTPSRMVLRS